MGKDSTRKALDSYMSRQIPRSDTNRKKHNAKPEKEVERACLNWMRDPERGWSVQIYSASATFNPVQGRWMAQSMKAGTVDCQGLMPDGTFVAVEFKAPGALRRFNLPKNHRQKEYLVEKIRMNAFGCVCDSARRLAEIFDGYKAAVAISKDQAMMYLMGELP